MNYKTPDELETSLPKKIIGRLENSKTKSITDQTKKHCHLCGLDKPLEDFYKKPDGGFRSGCKRCLSDRESARQKDKLQTKAAREAARKKSLQAYYKRKETGKITKRTTEKEREYSQNYRKKYPEKAKAKDASKIFNPPFEGAERLFWSYRPEHYGDFYWVKREYRLRLRKLLSYEQKVMLYRRIDSKELLTTKDKFMTYMREVLKIGSDLIILDSLSVNTIWGKNSSKK